MSEFKDRRLQAELLCPSPTQARGAGITLAEAAMAAMDIDALEETLRMTGLKGAHPLEVSPRTVMMAGDWHGDLMHARSAIEHAKRQGVAGILHLGDFGIWPGIEGRRYLLGIEAALRDARMWLCFIDGNHEDFPQLEKKPLDHLGARLIRPNLWHLPRGLRWTWHGKTWLALGGATSLDRPRRTPGKDWWPEESITGAQAELAVSAGPVDYMLTHDCPAGIDIPDLPPASCWPADELVRANAHRRLLRSIVDEVKPSRLWHGHFHVAYTAMLTGHGYECRVLGLNDNSGPFPQNVAVVELEAL
jgi:hypothetical protein